MNILSKPVATFGLCLLAWAGLILGGAGQAAAMGYKAEYVLATTLPDPSLSSPTDDLPINITGLKTSWAQPDDAEELYNLIDQMISQENWFLWRYWMQRPQPSIIPVAKVTLYVFHEVSSQTFFDSPAQSAARPVPKRVPHYISAARYRLNPNPQVDLATGARSDLVKREVTELAPGDLLHDWSAGVNPLEYAKRLSTPPPRRRSPEAAGEPSSGSGGEALQRVWRMQTEFREASLPKPPGEEGGIATWFTEETGLFSGEPWGPGNFIPRLFTIGGLVLLFLMGVELLRVLFGAGAKMVQEGLRRSRRD